MWGLLLLFFCCAAACWPTLSYAAEEEGTSGTELRLVAFGDIHGDFFRCRQLLQLANITDTKDRWIAGSSIVVQLGDIVDRGRHPHEIYDLFASLEQQAKEVGGEFIFLLGNHELMNLLGDFSYVHPDAMAAFGGERAYAEAFSPQGAYGSYLLQHPVSVVRKGVVFVHASIMPAYAARGVEYLNAMFSDHFSSERHPAAAEDTDKNREHPFMQLDSPLWARAMLAEAMEGNCFLLRESLRLLSLQEVLLGRSPVRMMVGGHSIQGNGTISVECNGSLVGADVGLSRFIDRHGGYAAYVELVPDKSNPQHRIALPQYPYGKGVLAPAPSLLSAPVQPPRRMKAVRRHPPSVGGVNRDLVAHLRARRGKDSVNAEGISALHCQLFLVLAFFCLVCVVRLRWRRSMISRRRGVCGS
ncbi:putative serine/threonine protein phosphatase [Trypanosoma rangeli]|uniref:Putative serine/threonine protein phosphatase n=1 Tax=Trypanosoma rangeli TaxID=5698 RepID=A0A3S5IRW3_TRYRA|nr:putative serine/threonine protein phosphatase [Trypanosoma rangeli]RNF09131.1 putative serine/threonine protein phosphatase [Trypanosoma rangeli]|eukprot:RNF09131.1 putative serine/threonine protein phosphatase [Trypanosoma rangeli]